MADWSIGQTPTVRQHTGLELGIATAVTHPLPVSGLSRRCQVHGNRPVRGSPNDMIAAIEHAGPLERRGKVLLSFCALADPIREPLEGGRSAWAADFTDARPRDLVSQERVEATVQPGQLTSPTHLGCAPETPHADMPRAAPPGRAPRGCCVFWPWWPRAGALITPGEDMSDRPPSWATSTRRSRLPADWSTRRIRVLRRDAYKCRARNEDESLCLAPARDVDHIERGDDHDYANLQALCVWHHARKTAAEGAAARLPRPSQRREPQRHPGLV